MRQLEPSGGRLCILSFFESVTQFPLSLLGLFTSVKHEAADPPPATTIWRPSMSTVRHLEGEVPPQDSADKQVDPFSEQAKAPSSKSDGPSSMLTPICRWTSRRYRQAAQPSASTMNPRRPWAQMTTLFKKKIKNHSPNLVDASCPEDNH